MLKPNLFSFATSELSQDAFICWILSWAAPEYQESEPELNKCANMLVEAFFSKHSKTKPMAVNNIEISKQDNKIDVLCIINKIYPIIIEDKTGTKNHSNQLTRYKELIIDRGYDKENILPIYFKTGEQAYYNEIENKGYKPFLRMDILNVLNSYEGDNEILLDYLEYLQAIEDDIQSFRTCDVGFWTWNSWVGFCLELHKIIRDGCWDYVNNPSGGFHGFWWNFKGDDNCKVYLQLENQKMCFKIWVKNLSDRVFLRAKWHQLIINRSNEFGLNLIKPKRFGNGTFMTVCELNDDFRITKNGIIDFNATLKIIKKAEKLIEALQN